MTQEQKDLLLKDLCARLPYRVICQCDNIKTQGVLKEIGINYNMCRLYDSFTDESENCYIFDCKPYLFPLSSMTEEQYYEMMSYSSEDCLDHMKILKSLRECTDFTHWPLYEYRVIDWYNKNHFDYRGLIPKGLAIDATGLNIY